MTKTPFQDTGSSHQANKLPNARLDIEKLQQEIDQLRKANYFLQQTNQNQLNKHNSKLSSVYNSLSWRITAPLRRFAQLLGRLTGICVAATQAKPESDGIYQEWINAFDTLDDFDREQIARHIATFPSKPLISVVMPVYNTPEPLLRKAIESVRSQLYPGWELCIADDASTAPHVRAVLTEYAEKDQRIKIVLRDNNGHISAASNSALELASGEYVAFLDHDDELSEHALYMVAAKSNDFSSTEIIYSDEDLIDEAGCRFSPFFKPDWSPQRFYGQNYLCHLTVIRRALIVEAGGFCIGFEGSQDYDLFLRCIARVKPANIRHIPFILYHWRATEGSTAFALSEKRYADDAGLRALADYFQSIDPDVTVKAGDYSTTYRVTYPLPEPAPLVSLIIPTRDGFSLLRRCISTIQKKTAYRNFELIVVDNQSTDAKTLEYLEQLKREGVKVLSYDAEFNYSAINNLAVKSARGQLVGLLNNDLEIISRDWLTEMVRYAVRQDTGAVGLKLLYPSNRIQHAGVTLGIGSIAGHLYQGVHREEHGNRGELLVVREVAAVTGACMLVRKELYEKVGGLDELDFPIAFNDVDFCLKLLSNGYRNLLLPQVTLYHHESASRGSEDTSAKRERFAGEVAAMIAKWREVLLNDPYYNPNLSLAATDASPSWPPRVQKPWKMKINCHE